MNVSWRTDLKSLPPCHPLDSEEALFQLFNEVARFIPPPLVPELPCFQPDRLDTLWIRAEEISGCRLEAPFWAFAWPGGQAVARYLLDHPSRVAGKRVLELACGNGLIGLSAARCGAVSVVNDIEPLALRSSAVHARRHGLPLEYLAGDLLSRAPMGLPFECVVVGDAFYSAPLAERLLPWLQAAAAQGCLVLIGDPGRKFLRPDGLTLLERYDVPTNLDVEGVSARAPGVYQL